VLVFYGCSNVASLFTWMFGYGRWFVLSEQLCFVSVYEYYVGCKVGFRFGSSELCGFVGRSRSKGGTCKFG
jgi:hypothetical protein